jgi:hypothetical protein
MSKRPKKRNKLYSGQDAKQTGGQHVTRYTAVTRSTLGEWWHEHKRMIKISGGIVAAVVMFGWLLFEAIRLIM